LLGPSGAAKGKKMDPRCAGPKVSEAKQQLNSSNNTHRSARQDSKLTVALTPEQQQALDKTDAFLHDPERRVFRLEGAAGTGKTTTAAHIPALWDGLIQYVAPTAKAALRLRQLGCPGARTIHSTIFEPPALDVLPPDYEWRLKQRRLSRRTLIVLDESSMVDIYVGKKLLSLGNKVVALGDTAHQLPPVNRDSFFRGAPDIELLEVHRAALGSPVLRLATAVRNGKPMPRSVDISNCRDLLDYDIVIAWTNKVRREVNQIIREERGTTSDLPVGGDRVICLRNYYDHRSLFNGTLLTVERVVDVDPHLSLRLRDDDGNVVEVLSPKHGFTAGLDSNEIHQLPYHLTALDYAFCLTAHRAQGSEWPRVAVLNETLKMSDAELRRRWSYTSITRAQEHVEIVRV
jgi:exodeoxyribonuclease V